MYSKKNIRIMYAMSLLQGMVFYGPIATLYRQSVGVTVFQITFIESVSLALAILLEIPWGVVADKIGYKKSMIICSLLYFISKIVFYGANGFTAFLIERIILSIVIAGLSGLDSSILYLSAPPQQSQKVFSIYNNLGTTGLIFAAGVYSIFVRDHYREAAFLTMISYAIAFFLSLGLDEVKDQDKSNSSFSLNDFRDCFQEFLKHKAFLLFLIAIALFNETHQTITTFLNQLQFIAGGLNNQQIGYIYIVTTLCGLLGLFSTYLTNKLGERRLIVILLIAMFIACSALTITYIPIISIVAIVGNFMLQILPTAIIISLKYLLPSLFGALAMQRVVLNPKVASIGVPLAFLTFFLKKMGIFKFLPLGGGYTPLMICVFGCMFLSKAIFLKQHPEYRKNKN